jgi:hypothetical protein
LIRLLGYWAERDHLWGQDEAYRIWMYCLMAAPVPSQAGLEEALRRDVMPVSFQDNPPDAWPFDPEFARAELRALVAREHAAAVAVVEAQAEDERLDRAAAAAQALALTNEFEQTVLRMLRDHERAFERAARAFLKAQDATAPDRTTFFHAPYCHETDNDNPPPPTRHEPPGNPEPAGPIDQQKGTKQIKKSINGFLIYVLGVLLLNSLFSSPERSPAMSIADPLHPPGPSRTSAARRAANKINAQRSSGVRTSEGKNNSK